MPKCCTTRRSREGGIALLPTFIAGQALHAGALISFLAAYKAPPLTLYAIYTPTRHLAVKVRLFIAFLVERFATLDVSKAN
jgi:DNA-binding transcriptional LysR family regulator